MTAMTFSFAIVGKKGDPTMNLGDGVDSFVSFKLSGPLPAGGDDYKAYGTWVKQGVTEEEVDRAIATTAIAIFKPYIKEVMEATFAN